MSPTVELLYHYFVGPPDPGRWPEELRNMACTPLNKACALAFCWPWSV